MMQQEDPRGHRRRRLLGALGLTLTALGALSSAGAADKPNILVVWGDDVGQSNISTYTHGLMGYQTPNIDRIAAEGMTFTDYYGEQSCTAGRSSFITGQSVFRTGLSKVGMPGADEGMQIQDPTIAGLLKAQGYATGQFGKNHLGDKDAMLPTNNGFDEFFGNLYHLNAEEEPENEDYPKNPEFRNATARGRHPFLGLADGTQKIEDTGPLTKKRMETVDDETSDRALGFIDEQTKAGKPWFVWWNGTRIHFRPTSRRSCAVSRGRTNTPTAWSSTTCTSANSSRSSTRWGSPTTPSSSTRHNGQHMNTWPDAAMTPFRGEKNTNWEAAGASPPWRAGRAHQGRHLEQPDRPSHGLAADLAGDRRGAWSQGQAPHRPPGERARLQSPPRRLQHPADADRRDAGKPAQGYLLLLR